MLKDLPFHPIDHILFTNDVTDLDSFNSEQIMIETTTNQHLHSTHSTPTPAFNPLHNNNTRIQATSQQHQHSTHSTTTPALTWLHNNTRIQPTAQQHP